MRRAAPLALTLVACSSASAPPPPISTTAISGGAVAACAGYSIDATAIASVAAHEGVAKRDALERLADDARFARAAVDRGLEATASAHASIRAALARALLHEISTEAAAAPTTPAELAKIRADHWLDLDRPEAFRVIHAVAIPKTPADEQAARSVAQQIAKATKGATSADDFRARASSVPPASNVEVRIESLSPVAKDGRVVEPNASGTYDPDFAAAAASLAKPNDEIGPTKTAFGFHVLHLLERLPAKRPTDADLLPMVREEVVANRSRAAFEAMVRDLRAREGVSIERSADDTLHLLDPKPPGASAPVR